MLCERGAYTPNSKRIKRGSDRRNNRGSSGQNYPGKQHFINSNTSSGTALRVRSADDVTRRPMVPSLSGIRIPDQVESQIHWFRTDFSSSVAANTTTITELNTAFQLSSLPNVTSITNLFDQYCIFCVYGRFKFNGTLGTNTTSRYFTALDYDNVNNVGSVASIQRYGTMVESDLFSVQERYVEPCNAPALYNGSAFSAYGQDRMWVDSANGNVPFYGIRCLVDGIGAGGAGVMAAEFTVLVCARNNI